MHSNRRNPVSRGALTLLLLGAAATPAAAQTAKHVPFFPHAGAAQQGFVRIVNAAAVDGTVTVTAVDDSGVRRGEVPVAVAAGAVVHFNSDDLENGNADKGIAAVGDGEGDWRLELASSLDFRAFAYLRTEDGFLASMHDLALGGDVPTFNPASNRNQASRLRLVNAENEAARVTIAGVDDHGNPGAGEVALVIPAGAAHTLTAAALETGGEGLTGALGDGAGKWRLTVRADRPIGVMSLLATPTGHVTNLSTRPPAASGQRQSIPVFAAADDAERQGFARVVNRTARAGEIAVTAIAADGTRRGPVPLAIGAGQTAHFNSDDLENGNPNKGLPRGVGDGAGDWRLELASSLRFEALGYMRTNDGFLTSTHDLAPQASLAPQAGDNHDVGTFNPASNRERESRLRIINAGSEAAEVSIRGIDDSGAARGAGVEITIPAGVAKTLTATTLEEGGEGMTGKLGDGVGKWRLTVTASQPIAVQSLLATPGGHLANLSTLPDANDHPRHVYIPDAGLRTAVFGALNKGADAVLTTDEMKTLVALDAQRANIANLRGIQYATELATLNLEANRITDLAPLATLTSLTNLWLFANDIKDISPLANLSRLSDLVIWYNRVSDLSPLAGLTALVHLSAGGNNITDISPLRGLTRLRYLYLEDNGIADISALANLTALEYLVLRDNRIADISPLANLTALVSLNLEGNRIADLGALRRLTNIRYLYLSSNRIADISVLSGFNNLETLTLEGNRVTDLQPLTSIGGAGANATVNVRENPLSDESLNTHIPALQRIGMTIQFSAPFADEDDFPNSRLTMLHADNVLVLHAAEDIGGNVLPFHTYANHVYRWFADEFDYLLFLSNLDDLPEGAHYYGVYLSVMNDTLGLGQNRFYTSRFGSAGKLRGVIHFPYRDGLLYGPGLHELHHAWGNYAVPSATGGHWGFSSANGQHGGFDRAELASLGENRYSAGSFGTFANGGNGVPYSPIELYFAGYVPPEEVPDLWFAPDGEWVIADDELVRTADGHAIFTAQDVRDYSINDIIAANGRRVPAMADAPWHHRAAVVLLVDDDHPATPAQLERVSEHVRQISHPQADSSALYNYYEATGGRGTITMNGLPALRRQTASTPTPPPSFGRPPPPQYCWITSDGRIVHRPPPTARPVERTRGD